MGLPLCPRSLYFLVLAAGQSQSAGESSTSLDRSATVLSTTAVAPVPGPIASIDPERQVRSPSPGALPLLPHGLFAPRGLFWLWHQPCSTSSHCSVQGPGVPGIPRPRFPGASITACWGFHFLPHLMVLLARLTFPSSEERSVLTALALAALNSSTNDIYIQVLVINYNIGSIIRISSKM